MGRSFDVSDGGRLRPLNLDILDEMIARRSLHTTSCALSSSGGGFFVRPTNAPSSTNNSLTQQPKPQRPVAQPHTPAHVIPDQSPNYPTTWSESQNPRLQAMKGPRFEQMLMDYQPQPLSAMEMIANEPIRLSSKRVAACDGGGGPLGHPKVFINLDKPGPKPCPYCGIRFELDHHAHH